MITTHEDDQTVAAIQQASFEAAKSQVDCLADSPELLKQLAKYIAQVAPPNSLPTRIQPRKNSR